MDDIRVNPMTMLTMCHQIVLSDHLLPQPMKTRLLTFSISLLIIANAFGEYPEPLATAADIENVPASTSMINIARLPAKEFYRLSKFTGLKRVEFTNKSGEGGTESQMIMFPLSAFPHFKDASFRNGKEVTDASISVILGAPSLESLQLEATAVTDISAKRMIQFSTHLRGVNVSGCGKFGTSGIQIVGQLPSLRGLSFSAVSMSTAEILVFLKATPHIVRYTIDDDKGLLDIPLLETSNRARAIFVSRNHQVQRLVK